MKQVSRKQLLGWVAVAASGIIVLGLSMVSTACSPSQQTGPIKFGMSAAFSGPAAAMGEAQKRGADLAIEEINAAGGVLARKIELVTRDNEHKQDKGVAQTRELIEKEGAIGILGSQGSFIGMAVIDTIHELKVPWFALSVGGVGIIENNKNPNYMFRLGANDRDVANFLVDWSIDKLGAKKLGILNEDTGWGVPAIDDLKAAMKGRGIEPVSADKVKVGETDFTPQMLRAKQAGAEVLTTFISSVEIANALKAGAKIGYKPKVVSAWAIANPTFPELAGTDLSNGTLVMQTFTFVNNERPKAKELLKRYLEKYKDVQNAAAIPFPSYFGDSYDTTHLLAIAIKKAGTTDGPKLRDALEQLDPYDGLIKRYDSPFPKNHEALSTKDYMMTEWVGSELRLVTR